MSSAPAGSEVVVVGAGIAGITCARVLAANDIPVRVVDQGKRVGGRLAVQTQLGHPIDVGASYLTVSDPELAKVVADWVDRGIARAWTDAFHVATPRSPRHGQTGGPGRTGGLGELKRGPMRYAGTAGLRGLVEDLAQQAQLQVDSGIVVQHVEPGAPEQGGPLIDGQPAAAVVLAMPDPQAARLLPAGSVEVALVGASHWEPRLVLSARWATRSWGVGPDLAFDGAFVHDSDVLTWIADDGRRRGDDAPVLVAHSTASVAAAHLDDPEAAAPQMLAELISVLDCDPEPEWTATRRWSLAQPMRSHSEPFYLSAGGIGFCGDGWGDKPRVEQAFCSGAALGRAIVERLSQPRRRGTEENERTT